MNRLLVICGPTATGKTKLAVRLSKVVNGQIISADSRQVYRYMDIGTGKERPVKILGYDLVRPDEEFSVKKYLDFANPVIKKICEKKRLPILVGGTGLYIKAITDDIGTINVPRDEKLRSTYAKASADELFEILVKIDARKANLMNESDRKNPRRLIRAIEIAQFKIYNSKFTKPSYNVLLVGLFAPKDELRRRIERRVDERIRAGFEKEIEFLKRKGYWNGVPKTTLGYKDWPDIDKWIREEFKYAKRQMVWFKKEGRIKWFNVSEPDWQEKVEELIAKWYSNS